ncbi:MAG: MATE family efflux transporter [Synergistaceae bacterium]|jgi:Na+-driven multidrug efflux pump|nr:MATE family efflux transporter [Synergistaceae bacterium]
MADTGKIDADSHPLTTTGIVRLLVRYATPSIIAMLVGALYNIVDQIFIGRVVGMLGNAATNVAFPLVTICMSVTLFLGIGGAANFNLEMGRGNAEKSARIAANAYSFMMIFGAAIFIIVRLAMAPMLRAFGATDDVMPYALSYTSITSLGIPFMVASLGGTHLIRADGSPKYSMSCNLVGASLNVALNSFFMFGLGMGIEGAAWGTVISQFVSWLLVARYIARYKSVRLRPAFFIPNAKNLAVIAALGAGSCFNQFAMSCVQVALNNALRYYGALSVYGPNIPLAAAGIISKVNMIYLSIVIGLAQGGQPIIGFNYGARKYARVRRTFVIIICASTAISLVAFINFQLFPRGIISAFGGGSAEYYHFVERYFRIFLFMTLANGLQPVTANFFTSIGKATRGLFMSLTRQIIFLLPFVLIFPRLWGIDGIMYAGPVADTAAFALAAVFICKESRDMKKLEAGQNLPARF